jgi:hypothetical protein
MSNCADGAEESRRTQLVRDDLEVRGTVRGVEAESMLDG